MTTTVDKIVFLAQAKDISHTWKDGGEKVVFTNGCFDILHLGHVDYLEKAAALGTKLILGVNTDASVKKLKGDKRPINHEGARARVLAALGFIDLVILFGEDTPKQLIDELIPNVLVKGGDYKIEDIVGGETVTAHGGLVTTIPFVEGYSTTSTLEKIISL